MLFCVVWNYEKSARLDFLSVFFVSNTNWNIINEYDKVLHGSMYFNVQVFLQKVMLCLFSLSIIQFSCSCLVKMCQFNCRSTSQYPSPYLPFPHLTFRRNSWIVSRFWKGRLSFFSNSASSSRPSWKQRGEKTLFQIHCVQEGGRRGEGDADGQVLWLSDWFTRTSPVIPLFHYATTAEQYHSTKVPLWLIHQNQASVIPVLSPYYSTTVSSVQHCPLPNNVIMSRILKTNF